MSTKQLITAGRRLLEAATALALLTLAGNHLWRGDMDRAIALITLALVIYVSLQVEKP